MRFAIILCAFGCALLAIAVRDRGLAWFACWPAVSAFYLSVAYALNQPCLLGKRSDGSVAPVAILFIGPYLLCNWFVWHISRLVSPVSPTNRLLPTVLIGRRLLPHEVPPDTRLIVDLTCEFPEPSQVRVGHDYLSCPILDGFVPGEDEMIEWVRKAADYPGVVLIHCAQGYGRTGTFAAILLLIKGVVRTPQDALHQIQTIRPKVRLNRIQREFVIRVAKRCGRSTDST